MPTDICMSMSDIDCDDLKSVASEQEKDYPEMSEQEKYCPEMSEQLRMKLFGASSTEMKNWHALQRLGVTYSELEEGKCIFNSNPSHHIIADEDKVERLTGFSMAQVKRAKALSTLGTNEDEFGEYRAKQLGSIGENKS
jgi:hypothetical protein